jgi:hypothetical protein
MSNIDSELTLLRQKIEILEKQKKAEDELKAMKEANPLATLGQIIEEKKKQLTSYKDSGRNKEDREWPINFEDMLEMMESIFYMLKNVQQRLEVHEQGRS